MFFWFGMFGGLLSDFDFLLLVWGDELFGFFFFDFLFFRDFLWLGDLLFFFFGLNLRVFLGFLVDFIVDKLFWVRVLFVFRFFWVRRLIFVSVSDIFVVGKFFLILGFKVGFFFVVLSFVFFFLIFFNYLGFVFVSFKRCVLVSLYDSLDFFIFVFGVFFN